MNKNRTLRRRQVPEIASVPGAMGTLSQPKSRRALLSRRRFLAAVAGAGVAPHLVASASSAFAQAVAKPARILVGFAPGGTVDPTARLLAEHMQGYAPSLIVENRPGAGGRIALQALKAAEPDGSVMVLTPVDQLALFPHVYSRLSYQPLEDFAPVTTVCSLQFLLAIGPKVPAAASSLADFIAWCRANPTAATYGSPGVGTHPHFLGATLARAAKFEFVHAPYTGGPALVQDVLAGHLAAAILPIGSLLPHVQSGALKALAATAPRRSTALPDVPTFKEAGYPMLESIERFGIVVPAGTPADAITNLNRVIREALQTEPVKAGLARLVLEPEPTSPSEFAQLIKTATQRWAEIVKESGFKPID
jgi:tripartite-type tricarboxylate transporter receptor subunit TctC